MALSLEQYRRYPDEKSSLNGILRKRNERERKRSLNVLIKNGDRIPERLVVEILSRLPVKTLLQFKTVCKSWYAIIQSSHFVTKHLRNYYDNDNNGRDCLIIQYLLTQGNEQALFELLMANKKNLTLEYEEIEFPRPICFYDHYLCGPCDGIYFLWCRFEEYPQRRNLWNPALNEVIILPDITWKPNISANDEVFINESYGFGYDSKTEDYKVILIWIYSVSRYETYNLIGHPMTILIYSLRTNSWRHWGDIDNYSYNTLERNGSYVFVNGCCYWLASRNSLYVDNCSCEKIVAFDIADDAYHEIPLPDFEVKPGYRSHVYVYRDSIAFVNIPDGYDTSSFSVWTWSEGVWTRMLSMERNKGIWGGISLWRDNTTLVFTHWRGELVLYDTNTKEIFILDEPDELYLRILNICAYKESLVSIKGFQMQNQSDEEKESE